MGYDTQELPGANLKGNAFQGFERTLLPKKGHGYLIGC